MNHSALYKRFCTLGIVLFLLSLLLTGIYESRPINRTQYRNQLYKKMLSCHSFSEFTTNLFLYEVTEDSITTAYHLRNPDSFHIPSLPAALSSFSLQNYEADNNSCTTKDRIHMLQNKLSEFSKNSLSSSEQITYRLLTEYFSNLENSSDFSYYEELLGPSTGIQTNLPITLCEYPLTSSSSVEEYLLLLEQVPKYFRDISNYETKREQLGYHTPAFLISSSKEQLQTILSDLQTDNNCFISTFAERIAAIDSLSQSELKQYEEKNTALLQTSILPAYQDLYTYLDNRLSKQSTVEKSDTISYGLSSLPSGTDYYSYLVRQATGSSRSIPELITMTDQALENALGTVLNIALTDQEAYLYYCEHPLETFYESPEAILEALSLLIREKYPLLPSSPQYSVKQVPDSLAGSLSPAFYMIPPLDDDCSHTIYVNPLYTNEENGNLFTTLAHEGFPGHLYQTVYFNSTNPAPLRQLLNYPGYVEGWATYVEMDAFTYINYPLEGDSLLNLYQSDTIINLALCSRIDLGVNYEGWTLNDTRQFFEDNGFHDYYAENIYSYVVEAPSNYLSYFIGYLELESLKKEYKSLKMNTFTEKDFHTRILNIGPADFSTIQHFLLSQ